MVWHYLTKPHHTTPYPSPLLRPLAQRSFNAIADAVKTGDWSQTAVDPPVVCDKGELYHMPCLGAATAGDSKKPQQCNKIASGVFGYETYAFNRTATQSVLPDRACSMIVGGDWIVSSTIFGGGTAVEVMVRAAALFCCTMGV